ncbi:hypothetical protein [Niabella beijingensis]|uniref:hypothetical protein n=1 Tax=Niabella beijingensis TaxID=2872700 RepID=UPI001CBFF19D|nr:hypothetical protein [Niabella beijingensis]MBZ4191242.1 hypothetical protein [Niabella beijingensis]
MKRFLSILMLIFLTSVPSLLFLANHQAQEEEQTAVYRPVQHRTLSQNASFSSSVNWRGETR